jgi:ubiquinone/menaquinone biosynthesis C-methylase UbiE
MHSQHQFDSVASAYLASAVHAQGEDLQRVANRIAQRPGARVLDIGCGAGHLTYAAAAVAREVTAYDLSERMLELVRQTAKERGLGNVRLKQGAAERLPFADASFDVVVSRFSAHHWLDLPAALAEMRRVLTDDGLAILIDVVSDTDPLLDTHIQAIELFRDASHVRDYTVQEWRGKLQTAGLRVTGEALWWLPMEFDQWIRRSQTPPERASAIREIVLSAPAAVRKYLAVQTNGSFRHRACQFEAALAQNDDFPMQALGSVLVP